MKISSDEILQRLYKSGIRIDISICEEEILFDIPGHRYIATDSASLGLKNICNCVVDIYPDSEFAKWWKSRAANGCCGEFIEAYSESLLAPPMAVCNNCKKEIKAEGNNEQD